MNIQEEAVGDCWSIKNTENSPVERSDARRTCREWEHGVDWSSARAVIHVGPSVTWDFAQIVCDFRPGVKNRISGDADLMSECTTVSPMRMRPGPRSSGMTAFLLSCDAIARTLRSFTFGIRVVREHACVGIRPKCLDSASAW